MKKNKALTAAISVLSLTMVSMCAIGGTFAKYTTNGSGQDTAKVAKWGVTVEVEGEETAILDTKDSNTEAHVKTNTGELMAPGTKGTLLTVSIAGTPEVNVAVDYTPTVTIANWVTTEGFYCPVVFDVAGTEINGLDHSTSESLKSALEDAINDLDDPEVTTEEPLADSWSVSWVWAFETGADDEKDANNAKDKLLGDLAAAGTVPSFTFDVSVRVEQLD